MTRKEVTQLAKELTPAKRKEVVEMLNRAGLLINSVECELVGLSIGHPDLILKRSSTLWCNIYDLQKLFEFESHE